VRENGNMFIHSEVYLFIYLFKANKLQAASRSATQEFSKILCNPKIHYRVYKIPLLVPYLRQMNAVNTSPSDFSKIHFNIILPPTSRSS
jgi:hypothetical protein